jgi:putative molybdopterin biosynthesis protein
LRASLARAAGAGYAKPMTKPMPDYLTTREVADLIRLKERKVYDLVATGAIPCVRVTGKLLFPRHLVEAWLAQHIEYGGGAETLQPRPRICAGSHDPLLDWALREAGTGLAVSFAGSLAGLEQMATGQAQMAGVHLPENGGEGASAWNVDNVKRALAGQPVVLIEWARRQQGLIVAPGNPLELKGVADLAGRRVIGRQREAGAFVLLARLLEAAGLAAADLKLADVPALTEADVAVAVGEDRADAGLGIATAAHQARLGFVPLIEERYDIAVWRAAYFDQPVQKLLAFARTARFAERAKALTGYDVSGLGCVRYNAP